MDRNGIRQFQIAELRFGILHDAPIIIHAQLVVEDLADAPDVTVEHTLEFLLTRGIITFQIVIILGLHHTVVQTKNTFSERKLRNLFHMRIDRLADQRIQAVGGRFSIRPVGRDDLKLSDRRILQFPQIELLDLRRGFLLIFCLDELKIWTIEQAAVFLVDEFGIVGDQAVLGLPEDLIENRHRHDAASNQLREHVARTDALQLIDVAQQQEFRALL